MRAIFTADCRALALLQPHYKLCHEATWMTQHKVVKAWGQVVNEKYEKDSQAFSLKPYSILQYDRFCDVLRSQNVY